jgi:hypothetical protein
MIKSHFHIFHNLALIRNFSHFCFKFVYLCRETVAEHKFDFYAEDNLFDTLRANLRKMGYTNPSYDTVPYSEFEVEMTSKIIIKFKCLYSN